MPESANSIGLILLAAGASTRFGQPKQLLPYLGRTLLRHAVETAVAAGCQPIVLVTGALHEELAAEVAGLPVQIVRNTAWATGMGSSIRIGLNFMENLGQPLDAVLVTLSDQPLVSPELLTALIRRYQATQAPIVATEYNGTQGVPALFAPAVFPALRELAGATGARKLIASQGAAVEIVSFPDAAVDVDTREQYEALLRLTGDEDGF
ncbi:nucleotidyltransferase family protein [Hymenobacter cavernae]|uniref:4-diphosphocytidyl-2C-methyl-D-erythritol kinase n=1 Tax=Hymenobacter cavernae TaxID=2044852 RepID=A0ABQ1U9V0_9BACT|nr:nucleotidyltransferase family protein [Hymenobacter cavernae]GGF12178.1 4-diphosphocytidyl-2C-methyl-D-erythritol kinase [Hymenobacter cavernae]